MALGQRQHIEVRSPFRKALPMADLGVGHHEHPGTRQVGAPAEVQVVTEVVDVGGEPAEGTEQIDAHEQAGGRQAEHVPNGVVLFLIELADLGRVERDADPVGAEADVLEHVRPIPVDEFGPDDAGV